MTQSNSLEQKSLWCKTSCQNTKHLFLFHIIFQLTACNAHALTIPGFVKESTLDPSRTLKKRKTSPTTEHYHGFGRGFCWPIRTDKHFNRHESKAFQNKKDSFICNVSVGTQPSAQHFPYYSKDFFVALKSDFNGQILQNDYLNGKTGLSK